MIKKILLPMILIAMFSCLFVSSLHADHFTKIWSGNGYQHMNFYITSAQINSVNLEANDEIAVFDGVNCVGLVKLTGTIGSYVSFVASCDDPTTQAVDGYQIGNSVIFKIWDSSSSTEYSEPALNTVYLSGTPVYQIGASAIVQINYSPAQLYNLVLSVSPEFSGEVTGYGAFEANAPVTISVTPAVNYRFLHWADENNQIVSNVNPHLFNMPASNLHYTAIMEYHVNQAPQLNFPAVYDISEDIPCNANFQEYMSDSDNNILELTLSAINGINVNVQIEGHDVTFTPVPNWNGQEDITFTLSDNMGRAIDTEVLHVNVGAAMDSPYLIQPMPLIFFNEDTLFQGYSLLTVFGDHDLPYGDQLTFTGQATEGININIIDDIFSITAAGNWFGTGEITFWATDNTSQIISTVLSVRVDPVPDAPRIVTWLPIQTQVNIYAGDSVQFEIMAVDDDGDDIFINWTVTGQTVTETGSTLDWTFPEAGTYYVQVNATDQVLTDSKMWTVNVEPSSSDINPAIQKTRLLANYPNPFNPSTSIAYYLEKTSHVNLEIFNSKGQLVKSLINKTQTKGDYQINWDGTDQQNQAVSSGIYLYRLQTDHYQNMHKMLLIK